MSYILEIWRRFQPLRFVGIGVWNTIFSYCVFAILYYLFGGGWRDVFVQISSGIIGITNAFLMHRFFTYHSNGVWWQEYLRFYAVYGLQILLQFGLFLVFATILNWNGYIVQFVLTVLFTFLSYWAHNNYSFSSKKIVRQGERR